MKCYVANYAKGCKGEVQQEVFATREAAEEWLAKQRKEDAGLKPQHQECQKCAWRYFFDKVIDGEPECYRPNENNLCSNISASKWVNEMNSLLGFQSTDDIATGGIVECELGIDLSPCDENGQPL